MNDLMSFGMHRLWKRFAISQSGVKRGHQVLDIAAGSGDLSAAFAKRVGDAGLVLVTDINAEMLNQGRSRLDNQGYVNNVRYAQTDAEQIPFPDETFDCLSISFGLRNVTDKARALKEMLRCLKPGGRLLVLEFSKPVLPFVAKVYDTYSFNVIPEIGRVVAGDRESYQYLVESIRQHPPQEELKQMMQSAGFDRVHYHNLTGGVVALHIGYKY
jgi:demethylmenaquinone methyltransferase/2-methoxy-6-polyprenyl-1,4-benzoquinol methylase